MALIKAAVFNTIGVGEENAVGRDTLSGAASCTDRDARRALEDLRLCYAIINLSDGNGYFIPEFTEEGIKQAERYRKMQLARIKSIKRSLKGTEKFIKEAKKRQPMRGQISLFDRMGGGG